ncbi:unnamed protein product [Rotaria sordida]|uniref:G protein-coupled receptor n=2 Tax=Rotaria sordida TaxID=392033 RepID=A0A815P4Y5_9BILA|nr:unnamed protein product [Rotaria sordida]
MKSAIQDTFLIGHARRMLPIVPFSIDGSYGLEEESRSCVLRTEIFAGTLYACVTVCLIPLNAVTIVYGIILYQVRQSTRRVMPFAPSGGPGNNVATPNMKREVKIMRQMSTQSGMIASGGSLIFVLCIWHGIKKDSAPEPLYLLAFTSITVFALMLTIAQFIMNEKVKSIAVQYICPRQPTIILSTMTQQRVVR